MKKVVWIISLILFIFPSISSAEGLMKKTVEYAKKDNQSLLMDIYSTSSISNERKPTIIFVFGGGFYEGNRDSGKQMSFLNHMAERGFVVTAIDYRLGLKDKEGPSLENSKPLANAVNMAIEDLFDATKYILDHADELNVDSTKIILIGSSAGGVTSLTANYIMSNQGSKVLPDSFNYSGIITFSGGIYSTEKALKYSKKAPVPTLLFHGTADGTVPYDKVEFADATMFGGKSIAELFRQNNYPYNFYSMEGFTHSVAVFPMDKYRPEIELFINEYIFAGKHRSIDLHVKDNDEPVDHQYD